MFRTGMPIHGKEFIDRIQHQKNFKTYLNENQHILIKAPRRFGKTSLVKHVFETNHYKHIYIDIRRSLNLTSLSHQIINQAYQFAGIENIVDKFKKSALDIFRMFRTNLKIDIGIIELTIEKIEDSENNKISDVEFFTYALDVVEQIGKSKDINIKFAMDEFQDILQIADKSIVEKIRAHIQHHEYVTYIFLGSIETIMNDIFFNKSSGFFHFVKPIELDGLNIKELRSHCESFFNEKNLFVDTFVYDVLEYLEGHPYYSMKLLQHLYFMTIDTDIHELTKDDIIYSLNACIIDTKPYLDEIIEKLKTKKHHHEVMYKLATNKEQSLDSASLYQVFKSLENMGYVVKKSRGVYKITDIFLKIYLQQDNDKQLIEGIFYYKELENNNQQKGIL